MRQSGKGSIVLAARMDGKSGMKQLGTLYTQISDFKSIR